MPYKSQAQRGKFHAMEERGEISPKVVNEFDKASKGMKLPKHVAGHDAARHHIQHAHDHLQEALGQMGAGGY